MPETIVLLDNTPASRIAQLTPLLPPGFVLTHGTDRGDAHMKAIIADADYAIAGQVGVSGEVLRAAKKLKLLHKWGVGVDNLDLEAARALGIKVARTTGSNAQAVAEFAVGLTLAAMRSIPYAHHHLQAGEWHGPSRLPVPGLQLAGKTVGIIGFGAIGSTVAKLLRGFECRILYAKRNALPAAEEAALGIQRASIERIITEADIISLNCPLTDETRDLIDLAALKRMKRTAVLINVARGGVVVEADLVQALKDRVIHAAAMDVFSVEPLPADSALIGLDNLVLTSHLAAVTADTFEPTVRRMFENIRRVSAGEEVPARDLVV